MAIIDIAVDRLSAKNIGANILLHDKLQYESFYGSIDFTDDEIPNMRAVRALSSGAGIMIKIPAGSVSPQNIDMSAYPQFGPNVSVTCEINKDGDTATLVEFADIQKVKNYTDNTYIELASIDIYGHADDAGNFLEDTFVTLKT